MKTLDFVFSICYVSYVNVHLEKKLLQPMLELITDTTFVVVDVETTGMSPWKNRITELAMVKVQDGDIVDEFSTLINPQQFIPPYITEFTGITNEMVFNAPKASDVMPKFLRFLGDAVLVAHNANFDVKFLNATLQRSGHPTLSNRTLCTCRLARRLLLHLDNKSLDYVAEHLGIDIQQRHRALGDAYATAQIFLRFLNRLSDEFEIEEFNELLSFQYKPISQFKRLPRNVLKLKDTIKGLPEEPGVYFLYDKQGSIIYIGKAKNLKDRVSSYFYHNTGHSEKVRELIKNVHSITYLTTGSELSALLLESKLIKEHRPHYNTLIKRYKRYPFIKIDVQSNFPRIGWSYDVEADGAEYFGPFNNRRSVESVVDIVNRLFLLRECEEELRPDEKFSPCIYYQIKRCGAPCAKLQTVEEYREEVDRVRKFITGKHQEEIAKLENAMQRRADTLRFEEAAELRDRIRDLKRIISRQQIIMKAIKDHNLIIMIPSKRTAVELFFIRSGRLKFQTLTDQSNYDEGELMSHVQDIYFNSQEKPMGSTGSSHASCRKEELDEMKIISSWLSQNKENGKLIYVEPHHTTEDILQRIRAGMATVRAF